MQNGGSFDSYISHCQRVTRCAAVLTKANQDWTSSDGGQLRLYKRRPNPFQLEKGASEPEEDEAPREAPPRVSTKGLCLQRNPPV